MKKTSFFLVLLLVSCCWAVLPVHGYAWINGWDYRKTLAVSQSSDAGTNYQLNFTLHYGSGTDSDQNVYLDGHCQVDFDDIRFTEDDGTTYLDHWRKSYTSADQAEFWVEISANLTEAAAQIYVYYGNSEADSASDQAATFIDIISDVTGAWLMDENNETDLVIDSSGQEHDGTPTGTSVIPGVFEGKNARNFNGSGEGITIGHSDIFDVQSFSLSLWFNATLVSNSLFANGGYGFGGFHLGLGGSGSVFIEACVGSAWTTEQVYGSTQPLNDGFFHSVVLVIYSNHTVSFYIDGVYDGGGVLSDDIFYTGSSSVYIAQREFPSSELWFKGVIDETIFYNQTLSSAKIENINAHYGDSTLEESKLLIRNWVYPVPSVVAGSEEITVAPQGSLLASVFVGCLILIPLFIVAVVALRRR